MALKIDTSNLARQFKAVVKSKGEKLNKKIVKKAATAIFAHAQEIAKQELHKRKAFFLKNLTMKEQNDGNSYQIIIKSPAVWIEAGLGARQLRDTQLGGAKNKVIPISDGELIGNAGRKNAPRGEVKFRTMKQGQPGSMWKTKAVKGIQTLKKSVAWFREKIKGKQF